MYKITIALFLVACSIIASPVCIARTADLNIKTSNFLAKKPPRSEGLIRPKNPWIAGALSIVPGLGQIYNGKRHYWKTPIMLGGVGLLYLAVAYNNDRYEWFRDGYNLYLNEGKDAAPKAHYSVQSYVRNSDSVNLLRGRDFYLSQKDFWVIFMVIGWAVNIIEAITSAHFSTFDISDTISLRIQPTFTSEPQRFYAGNNISAGVALTLTF